jgi:hypothetical protein
MADINQPVTGGAAGHPSVVSDNPFCLGGAVRIMETPQTDQDLTDSLHVIIIPKNESPEVLQEVHRFHVRAYLFRVNDEVTGDMTSQGLWIQASRWIEDDELNIVRFHFDGPTISIRRPGVYRFFVRVERNDPRTYVANYWSHKFTITQPQTNGVH